jgi:hypothetical protein
LFDAQQHFALHHEGGSYTRARSANLNDIRSSAQSLIYTKYITTAVLFQFPAGQSPLALIAEL